MSGLSRIYIWDNGEDFLDHTIWFVESDLGEEIVRPILDAAASRRSRRGGLIAIVPTQFIHFYQQRIESLSNWFTCYGDGLVDWRDRSIHESLRLLPQPVAKELARCLYPSNADIMLAELGLS